MRFASGSIVLDHLEQTIVHKHSVAMTKSGNPLLFDADVMLFATTYYQFLSFANGFIDQADMPFNRLVVYLDHERAEERIKIVLNTVLLYFADFDGEFHEEFLVCVR